MFHISRSLRPITLRASKKPYLSQVVNNSVAATDKASAPPPSLENQPPEPAHIKAIVDQIAQLKFFEVTLLNEALKRELKIPDVQRVVAAAPMGAAATADGDGGVAAGIKTSFTVKLTKFEDSKKVALIKEIKKLVEGINLVEAKRFVEECPRVIKSNLSKDEAENLQKQLEAAGGVVKLE